LAKPNHEHLLTEQTISLSESLFGFSLSLTHMDGRKLLINSDPGVITEGAVRIVRGEGMPTRVAQVKGDLYIKFHVTMPTSLTMDELRVCVYPCALTLNEATQRVFV